MASIELVNLTKTYGNLVAVDALDLRIEDKAFVALLGPSGCGKTTTMNLISGILKPTAGEIRFDGEDVRGVPAGKRDVGFVFQNYAIFTHLSVYKNISFGLEIRRRPKAEIEARVREVAALVGLTGRLADKASNLGVNELQRLAIARSAVINPKIFLLDEPLSNLDAAFRAEMRTELKRLQHRLRQTMVYVTHDQLEAMSMADRIAVMDHGVLQQYDTPLRIYNQPRNLFVARFIGSPSMNLLSCRLITESDSASLDFGPLGRILVTGEVLPAQCAQAKTPEVIIGVRPEDITLRPGHDRSDGLAMTVSFVERIASRSIVHLREGKQVVKAVERNNYRVELGEPMTVTITPDACRLFDAISGLAIAAE